MAFTLGLALLSAACVSQSYMGISFVPGQAPAELQALARRAQNGNRQAQLELGIRFEEGEGLAQDVKQAMELYKRAATPTGGVRQIYVPSQGANGLAMTIPIHTGFQAPGLVEARQRLATLEERVFYQQGSPGR